MRIFYAVPQQIVYWIQLNHVLSKIYTAWSHIHIELESTCRLPISEFSAVITFIYISPYKTLYTPLAPPPFSYNTVSSCSCKRAVKGEREMGDSSLRKFQLKQFDKHVYKTKAGAQLGRGERSARPPNLIKEGHAPPLRRLYP